MNPVIIDRVALAGESNGLYARYIDGTSELLSASVGTYRHTPAQWKSRVGSKASSARVSADLFESLADANAERGVSAELVAKLRGAGDGSVRFVITGQQPGALGGALMILYKVASAVALAARIERDTGKTCVPLYWVGSDDADFAEIREAVLITPGLETVAVALPTKFHEVGAPVGNIDVGADRVVWDSVAPMLSSHPGFAWTEGIISAAIDSASDHGDLCARLIISLFGGKVAFVDGRNESVRHAARDLILDYFDREDDLKKQVLAAGNDLEASGLHAQLAPGEDSGVFLLNDGRRQSVPPALRRQARETMATDIVRASPGVILRNLVQDYVFNPVAVVLGPAEIAYRAQIAPVYDALAVDRPVVFPRMAATMVPELIVDAAEQSGLGVGRLVADPVAFTREVAQTQVDANTSRVAREFSESFLRHSGKFVDAAGRVMDARQSDRLRKRLDDVGRRLDQALAAADETGRAAAHARWPGLEHVPDVFARRTRPQERYLSVLSPYLSGGASAEAAVREAAEAHVGAAMDAVPFHVVYSVTK